MDRTAPARGRSIAASRRRGGRAVIFLLPHFGGSCRAADMRRGSRAVANAKRPAHLGVAEVVSTELCWAFALSRGHSLYGSLLWVAARHDRRVARFQNCDDGFTAVPDPPCDLTLIIGIAVFSVAVIGSQRGVRAGHGTPALVKRLALLFFDRTFEHSRAAPSLMCRLALMRAYSCWRRRCSPPRLPNRRRLTSAAAMARFHLRRVSNPRFVPAYSRRPGIET